MKNYKVILQLILLIMWVINSIVAVITLCRGEQVSAWCYLFPSIECVLFSLELLEYKINK
jgi:hypothetical protein